MHLSKKTKVYIFIFVLLIVGIFFVSKVTSKSISYSATPSTPPSQLSASVNTAHTDTPTSIPISQTTKSYKVDKNFRIVPIDPNADKKVVLLTIDDGPSKQSENLMKILEKYNIKAIFFINGIHDKEYAGVIKKEYDAGHTIGNHTWQHLNLSKIKEATALDEINKNTKLIKDITGEDPHFFRPPFGVSTPYVREYLKKENMIFMNWSGSTLDWEKSARDKKVFVNNVMKNLQNGTIILMHEHQWDTDNLEDLILAIQAKGYTFANPKEITQ